MSLLQKSDCCLSEGLFQSNILVLEKYSWCCSNMSQIWRRGFSVLSWLCQTCTIATSSGVGWFLCGLGNPFVVLYAQFPENPLRKYVSIQDVLDGNKEYFRCRLLSGSSRTPFFTDLPSACSMRCGLQSCPTCQEQQLERSLWLQCEQKQACDDFKKGQVGREQSTSKSS